VEAPRFQTEHFYSSFAGHEFVPGVVRIEGRMPPDTARLLSMRGHTVRVAGDWSNGSSPVVIQAADGILNGGADPRRSRFIFGK
jgi:gamma-glutamyltranspeptidase/glutathione hydrolase